MDAYIDVDTSELAAFVDELGSLTGNGGKVLSDVMEGALTDAAEIVAAKGRQILRGSNVDTGLTYQSVRPSRVSKGRRAARIFPGADMTLSIRVQPIASKNLRQRDLSPSAKKKRTEFRKAGNQVVNHPVGYQPGATAKVYHGNQYLDTALQSTRGLILINWKNSIRKGMDLATRRAFNAAKRKAKKVS